MAEWVAPAASAILAAGFEWTPVAHAGYWRLLLDDGSELALEPLIFDAGAYALALYDRDREPILKRKIIVDVKP
jgi:hypothetical protein